MSPTLFPLPSHPCSARQGSPHGGMARERRKSRILWVKRLLGLVPTRGSCYHMMEVQYDAFKIILLSLNYGQNDTLNLLGILFHGLGFSVTHGSPACQSPVVSLLILVMVTRSLSLSTPNTRRVTPEVIRRRATKKRTRDNRESYRQLPSNLSTYRKDIREKIMQMKVQGSSFLLITNHSLIWIPTLWLLLTVMNIGIQIIIPVMSPCRAIWR